MNKRALFFIVLGVSLLALSGSQLALGKAHVPLGKVQVCHSVGGQPGRTLAIAPISLEVHLDHSDCRLPVCDFNNAFPTGTLCPEENAGTGFCVLENSRDSATGITARCTEVLF